MLKYKGTDVVVYFTHNDIDYRRVDGCWEFLSNGSWILSHDCADIERQYKKRTSLRNLIKRKDELNSKEITNISKENELTATVREIIDTVGISSYIDKTSQQLLDMLDTGELSLK